MVCVDKDTNHVIAMIGEKTRPVMSLDGCNRDDSISNCVIHNRDVAPPSLTPAAAPSMAPSSCHDDFTDALDKYFQSCPNQMRTMCGTSDTIIANLCRSNAAHVHDYTKRLRDLTEKGRCEAPAPAIRSEDKEVGICGTGTVFKAGYCIVQK